MNTKDLLLLGVPLGEATQRAPDCISKFILRGVIGILATSEGCGLIPGAAKCVNVSLDPNRGRVHCRPRS